MSCEEAIRWIGPLLDGELDARNDAAVRVHLGECPACQRRYDVESALVTARRRADLSYTAPDSLRRHIAQIAATPQPPSRWAPRWALLAGWPVAAAASALLVTVLLQQRSLETDEIIATHVRSLQASHLSDVLSSDHHTVKPWFAGKIDFAPPVPDLSAAGFELVGGRLDYLESQPVAAVVYRKHGHIINVLTSLPGHVLKLPPKQKAQGYSLRAWRQGGLELVAVSDIDPLELAKLQRGYAAPVVPTGEPGGPH